MTIFAPLQSETCHLLNGIPALIDKTFPLPGRFRSSLPADVAELSRLLTSGRGERGLSFLGKPSLLSAYLRFFLPWNLYRLCRLMLGLDISLSANDRITDLGCGPLTLASALWLCRPDLRTIQLAFYCIDRSGPALDAGKKFFAALTGNSETSEKNPWKIHTVKGDLATARAKPSALVCAVNVFNEMYGDISRSGRENLQRNAENAAHLLESHSSANGVILVVEPGFPRCGEFISLLRGVFLERGHNSLSPCPHAASCPFPGGKCGKSGKDRWCHFAFETEDAPAALHRLSAAAGLPKERATLSFLLAGQVDTYTQKLQNAPMKPESPQIPLRVISDAFPLPPNRFGRYCCSQRGLVLLTGEKAAIEKTASGSLVNAVIKKDQKDPKSGALIAEFFSQLPHAESEPSVRQRRREKRE
jgi:hypothetical protein